MKKILILLCTITFILCGCQKKENSIMPLAIIMEKICDGVTLDKIYISNWSCQDQLSPYKTLKIKCGYIDFDIDGANKGKNTWGVDIFRVAITKEGIVPYYPEEELTNNANSIYQCTQTGFACLVWVLEKGNMGYLKVTHDGNAKCPDKTKITWERGSCK